MSDAIFEDPRIKGLLTEADSLRHMLETIQDEQGLHKVHRVLDGIYHDLGQALHELLPRVQDFEESPDTEVMNLTELNERMRLAEVTEETDLPPPIPLWDPDDEITSVRVRPRMPLDDEVEEALGFEGVRQISEHSALEAAEDGTLRMVSLGEAHGTDPDPSTWLAAMGDMLELIALPDDLDLASELAAEASRIQWATLDIEPRWAPFPQPIQLALLGLLAARARHLQSRLDASVGPRLALERLTAYQEQTDLAKVVGLQETHSPELSSWEEDARKWWETLLEGVQNI